MFVQSTIDTHSHGQKYWQFLQLLCNRKLKNEAKKKTFIIKSDIEMFKVVSIIN